MQMHIVNTTTEVGTFHSLSFTYCSPNSLVALLSTLNYLDNERLRKTALL